ncbi:S-adenosyl-L-methionine-dependent methyltransferase [Hesseltinella vesiculosa]|uniref:type I protein arginine methyltransferase n=1 Tax=Hesseltinella vesiculosa TaxID=101127 RepID=A0A1X2G593_9FUNG|nr:S-adenosyl-L-methionine-dependent methyltransferase [Hesseltinella vesiculosa]
MARRFSTSTESEYVPSEFDPKDEAWDDWEEEDMISHCLFCPETFEMPSLAFDHCKSAHGFDFLAVKQSLNLDFYKCIRMINYIRKQALQQPELATTTDYSLTGQESFWDDDTLLQPVLEEDALLHAFEELELDDREQTAAPSVSQPTANDLTAQLAQVQPKTPMEAQLLQLLHSTLEKNTNLEGQFDEYKSMVKSTFYDKMVEGVKDAEDSGKPVDESNYYFNGYAHNDIHEQMLKDRARTEAYRDFIYENKDIFKDKVVLDVGCGTGILSMFAAKAGAKQVIAVDNSAIIEKAKLNAKENELDQIITFVRGKVEEIELPVKQVDIIVSEWMGYFLLFEAMLDSVLVARDRWLAPSGILAPSHCRILLAGLDDDSWRDSKMNFWNDVYGFKMTAMKQPVMNEAIVDFFNANSIVTDVVPLKDLYLQNITVPKLDFVSKFEFKVKRAGTLEALGGWFDTWFTRDGHAIPMDQEHQQKEGETFLTTGPHGEDTHWKQTIFVLAHPLEVKPGDCISGMFICHKGTDNPRELECEIEYSLNGGEPTAQNYTLTA